MGTHNSNVVAFETLQTKQQDDPKRKANRVVAECRSIFLERLGELLLAFFTKVDDELFKLSDKAENSTLQSLYFESMRHVRREKDAIQGQFRQGLLQQYDDFWQDKLPRTYAENEKLRKFDEDNFSLVENETLEEDLAINAMIGKGNTLFHHELFALDKRFAALLGKEEIPIENNPVAPAALCRGFEGVLKPQAMELKIKLLLYKLFDRLVLSAFCPVYHELNAHLVNAGILPTIAKTIKRHPASLAGSMRNELGLSIQRADATDDNAAYMETFQAMQSLLDGWRNQLGLSSYSAGMQTGGPIFDSGEILNALSVLQHPLGSLSVLDSAAYREVGHPETTEGSFRAVSGEELKLHVTNQLGKLQPGGQIRPFGRFEEDTIDMVAMIFDFILEDRNLPDPIKALIARLQIPIVKIAILEKSFFAKKSHPARVLLNSLAQAGIGLDGVNSDSENPIFQKIEEIIGRIIHEFDQDVSLFYGLLEDFTAFMEKESQRSRIAEERTRQVTQSKEQVRLAKKKVAYEIALRLRGKQTPSIVRSFLYNAWKDVLVLAYLRRDKESADWGSALSVMDQLIWSVTPPADANLRQQILRATPPLLKAIREGLESISFDPHQVTTLLDALETCHADCLRISPPSEYATESQAPQQATVNASPTSEIAIKDHELAEAILAIRANLPDIDDIRMEEVGLNGVVEEIILTSLQQPSETAGDEFTEKAQALNIGEWLEFVDEQQKPWRAKLSWKSQVTALYVFVNRKGVKVAEMNIADLASRLRDGAARIIEGSTVPLMDRALSALMHSLQNPSKKAETPA